MRKKIDKQNFMYDVLLTLSLIFSSICASGLMHLLDLWGNKNEFIIFIIITFLLIKFTYNISKKIYRMILFNKELKRMRK